MYVYHCFLPPCWLQWVHMKYIYWHFSPIFTWTNYLLSNGDSYGLTAQNIWKIAQSSSHSCTMYINENEWNKVLLPYVNSLCCKMAHFLFISTILCKSQFSPQLKIWRIFIVVFDILYSDYRRSLVSILGVPLVTFVGFLPSISLLRWWTWYMVNIFITNDM